MRSKVLTISGCAIVLALVGCTNDKVNVGDDAPVRTGASLSDYAGTWEGYVEAHVWQDSSDSIRIQLDQNGNGVLEVGDTPIITPPAIDPEHPPAYLPNVIGGFGGFVQEELVPGFSFPIVGATVESKRIRFSVVLGEPYRAWCEAQTPYLDEVNTSEGPRYMCLPNVGIEGDAENNCFLQTDTEHANPFSCDQLACQHSCTCDAEGCTLMNDIAQMVLDAELTNDGEELDGTLVHQNRNFNVNMTLSN